MIEYFVQSNHSSYNIFMYGEKIILLYISNRYSSTSSHWLSIIVHHKLSVNTFFHFSLFFTKLSYFIDFSWFSITMLHFASCLLHRVCITSNKINNLYLVYLLKTVQNHLSQLCHNSKRYVLEHQLHYIAFIILN